MVRTIPQELGSSEAIITAAETDDEIGTVLRLHLVIEKLLDFYLDRKRVGEIKTYTIAPSLFGGKLSLSVAFGFPIALARIAHQINNIRNKLAHGKKGCDSINSGDIKELARRVNQLSEIYNNFTTIEKRYVELPTKFPDRKIVFGSDSLRIDFLIATMVLYKYALDLVIGSET